MCVCVCVCVLYLYYVAMIHTHTRFIPFITCAETIAQCLAFLWKRENAYLYTPKALETWTEHLNNNDNKTNLSKLVQGRRKMITAFWHINHHRGASYSRREEKKVFSDFSIIFYLVQWYIISSWFFKQMPNMITERKRGSFQTMTFLVGVKFCYHCFCLANASLLCELESTVHVCICNAMVLTFLTFVYNVAFGGSCWGEELL